LIPVAISPGLAAPIRRLRCVPRSGVIRLMLCDACADDFENNTTRTEQQTINKKREMKKQRRHAYAA